MASGGAYMRKKFDYQSWVKMSAVAHDSPKQKHFLIRRGHFLSRDSHWENVSRLSHFSRIRCGSTW